MDGSRSLKRPSDGESSGNSQRQKVEGHASGGFASGEAGRRSTRFMPIAHSQELHERRENSSFEVPASQQIGTEYLLELRGQIQQANQLLQDTYHQNQTVLEHLDQQVAKIQQDTRALENSFHPPARNEQSMPQHQQEEVFDIHDYLNLSSDSDDESDQRELLEAHEAKGVAPIQSSTSHSSDTQLQKSPLDNLKQKDQIEQRPDARVQQHEVYNQAGSSRQGDAQLDPKDRKTIEDYTKLILTDEKWNHFRNSPELSQKEFLSGLVSHFPMETIQQAEQVRKDQQDAGKSDHLKLRDEVEQDRPRQSEAHDLASQTDMITQMKQIEDAPLTWKRRREMLERLTQSSQPPEPEQTGQIDMIEVMKHIENLTELTWRQRREMLEGWIRLSQPPEQRQPILPQRHEGQDQAGPSHHGDAQRESLSEQERTWTTEELHQLVDEMVGIKHFDHKTFQDSLSEESKAICEQLNKYGRSFNDQEWDDIRTQFQKHKVLNKDKRYKYLHIRTENSRNLQKMREIRANSKSQQQGFKNRHKRLSKKKRLNDASEPS